MKKLNASIFAKRVLQRSVLAVCVLSGCLVGCGPGGPADNGGGSAGGSEAAGGGAAAGGGSAAAGGGSEATGGGQMGGGTSATGGGSGSTGGGSGTGGGAEACSPSNCLGCCFNGACQTGNTAAACGGNGVACSTCVTGTVCLTSQTCGIDPESVWIIQPSSVDVRSTTLAGDAWDALGGAPDPYANLYCPLTENGVTASTPTVNDVFKATWTTGSCTMKAKDLMTTGFAIEVLDEDIANPDSILDWLGFVATQEQLLFGGVSYSNNTTCTNLFISITPQ